MNACFKTKKDREYGTAFMRNGGLVLEKLIALRNGKCNPICGFSAEELKIATNNYEERQVLLECGWFKLYNGFLQDRPILVKKFEDKVEGHSYSINEIPFASHMSVHKNVLKLLGCCLETEVPILVFESVKYGSLDDYLHRPNNAHFEPLLWKQRLKIAVDIANVVAYLHTAFPRPIVHRDVVPKNILLDEHYVAKLTDFSHSISIPDGETHVQDDRVEGTLGYLAPENIQTARFNEKNDIYCFGVCLLELLTGKRPSDFCSFGLKHNEASGDADNEASDDADNEAFDGSSCYTAKEAPPYSLENYMKKHIEDNGLNEMLDPIIVGEGPWPGKEEELQSVAALALRCISETEDSRPATIDVGKELRQIYRSGISPI